MCRRVNQLKVAHISWRRKRSPIVFELNQGSALLVSTGEEILATTESFPPKIKKTIERAIYWIGKSIDEIDFDLKVTALCTAMETLLTTKSDKRKGEAIAYRMALLEAHFEGAISHPGELLWIYELRSSVVHGSNIDIASSAEYSTMLGNARDTLRNFINYSVDNKITKQSDLIHRIENSDMADTLLTWLQGFADKNSREIYKALKQARSGKGPVFIGYTPPFYSADISMN